MSNCEKNGNLYRKTLAVLTLVSALTFGGLDVFLSRGSDCREKREFPHSGTSNTWGMPRAVVCETGGGGFVLYTHDGVETDLSDVIEQLYGGYGLYQGHNNALFMWVTHQNADRKELLIFRIIEEDAVLHLVYRSYL